MKAIKLFFLACVLCCFSPLLAQDEIGNGLIFPNFEKGTVLFKNGVKSSALLNYSMFQQEMLFQDADNTIMALANVEEVIVVTIGERRFFPISTKGIFYEEIQAGNGYFFVQYKAYMLSEGKASAYGGYSQTSSITSYGNLFSSTSGTVYQLNPDEKFRLKTENIFYLLSGKSYKKFISAKTLGKLFKGNESKIEEFAKEQSINFSKTDDIARIVEYGYSLPKK